MREENILVDKKLVKIARDDKMAAICRSGGQNVSLFKTLSILLFLSLEIIIRH